MALIERLKRDLTKHPAKAAVLGILFVLMVAMSIKAAFELRSTEANTTVLPSSGLPNAAAIAPAAPVAIGSIQESRMLWDKLREVKNAAAAPAVAFTFDASFYPPPIQPVHTLDPNDSVKQAPAPAPLFDSETVRIARIKEQARALSVKSTIVGNGLTQPVAIVNQQVLTIGQQILGFEIVSIQAREVVFKKEGVLTPVKMSDDTRGQ